MSSSNTSDSPQIRVKKKNGTYEDWDFTKIIIAVGKSAERAGVNLTDDDLEFLDNLVTDKVGDLKEIPVADIHAIVEQSLQEVNPEVAASYIEYRSWNKQRINDMEEIYDDSQEILFRGNRENANFNSELISTKGSLLRRLLTTNMFKQYYMSKDEKKAMKDGFLYFHDRSDLVFAAVNCCLFDMKKVLAAGFEMSNVDYREPKGIHVALQVLTDITVVATAQQFGGFTIPQADILLIPYFRKSLAFWAARAERFVIPEKRQEFIMEMTMEELKQGLQAMEMRLNTVPSSRGDTAFVTITFGNCAIPEDAEIQRIICHAILDTRMKGQGNGAPVVFPKLVYLHKEAQHQDPNQAELFDHAIHCNQIAMYPDYLSLDYSEVGDIYDRTGKVVSPMGCRAFLSEDPSGEFEGRANIGAVSLNLPMIWKESEGKRFWDDLHDYLHVVRNFLKKRYAAVADNVCSTNPLAFTQGGVMGGNKSPDEKIGMDIVKTFTASFGITALNELNVLVEGVQLHESPKHFVNDVVDFINHWIRRFKEEDGYLYALYGTPAESLAGTQLKQFRNRYGVIPGVSDTEYFSNSFHCHVSADITPFEKQDHEFHLFHKINGGHIQYVRIEDRLNFEAIKAVVKRGMRMGFYQGINFDLVVCNDCGHRPEKYTEQCPECTSKDITVISRICGYLGFRLTGGNTRVNDTKLAEMLERKSM